MPQCAALARVDRVSGAAMVLPMGPRFKKLIGAFAALALALSSLLLALAALGPVPSSVISNPFLPRELGPTLLVVLGGGVTVLAEAPVDLLGMCYWVENGQWTLYETFGRKIPVMTLFSYTAFFGGVVLALLQQFRAGITYRGAWKWFWIWSIVEFTSEPLAMM